MCNNKKLICDILNNVVLRNIIFEHVWKINYLVCGRGGFKKSVKWTTVVESPSILISYGYLEELRSLVRSNRYINFNSEHLYYAVAHNHQEILDYALQYSRTNYGKYTTLKLGLREFEKSVTNKNVQMLDHLLNIDPDYPVTFDHLMGLACQSGSLETCEYIKSKSAQLGHPIVLSEPHLLKAAECGHLHILIWLCSNGNGCITNDVLKKVVSNGHLDILEWIAHEHADVLAKFPWSLMDIAASRGHLNIVQWLHENATASAVGCRCTRKAMDSAASNSHFEVVRWLHANRTEGCTSDAMDGAAYEGALDIVQWLHSNRTEGCTSDAMDLAAANGHVSTIKWLHENRSEGYGSELFENALTNGQTNVLDYAFRNGFIDPKSLSFNIYDTIACETTHLPLLEWLHQNGGSKAPTDAAVDRAARLGHLSFVKFIFEKYGVKGSASATQEAALFGHLEVIRYLNEVVKGPSTAKALDNAAFNGHFDVVRYLHENRTEGCTVIAIDIAASGGHIDIIKYLTERRTERFTKAALAGAASCGNLELFKYLLDAPNSPPFDMYCLTNAASNGHLRIIKYLYENYPEKVKPFIRDAYLSASQKLQNHILKYLDELVDITLNLNYD